MYRMCSGCRQRSMTTQRSARSPAGLWERMRRDCEEPLKLVTVTLAWVQSLRCGNGGLKYRFIFRGARTITHEPHVALAESL